MKYRIVKAWLTPKEYETFFLILHKDREHISKLFFKEIAIEIKNQNIDKKIPAKIKKYDICFSLVNEYNKVKDIFIVHARKDYFIKVVRQCIYNIINEDNKKFQPQNYVNPDSQAVTSNSPPTPSSGKTLINETLFTSESNKLITILNKDITNAFYASNSPDPNKLVYDWYAHPYSKYRSIYNETCWKIFIIGTRKIFPEWIN